MESWLESHSVARSKPVVKRLIVSSIAALSLFGCKDKEVDASQEEAQQGEVCTPTPDNDQAEGEDAEHNGGCAAEFSCEPIGDGDGDGEMDYVCAVPLEIRGQVFDSITGEPIEGALVSALDETGAPVTDVAVTDAEGFYVLPVSAIRDPSGEILRNLKWTLFVTAADYQPFPAGVRPALPIDSSDAFEEPIDETDTGGEQSSDQGDTDGDRPVKQVIENASTSVALILLPGEEQGGIIVSGTVGGEEPRGTLVVAETGEGNASYTIADASGHYTLFNVPDTGATIVGYRQGLSLEIASVSGGADIEDVDLAVIAEGADVLPDVTGSVNIVNADGSLTTSVVLVPVSVYNEALERGPVPFGLRAPQRPEAPTIQSAFAIESVPPGTYKVLAAFENDDLVRDPDESIAGTGIQEITVGDASQDLAESFKITEDLEIFSPGADAPEVVPDTPTFVFADDSSEDRYEIKLFDALGELVWENLEVPGQSGGDRVEIPYDGPALTDGMYYQFRVTSYRDTPQGSFAISRTEDLQGVFVFGSAEPPASDGGDTDGGTGG